MNTNIKVLSNNYRRSPIISSSISSMNQDGILKMETIYKTVLKEQENFFDINCLYCTDHKKLKKYYIKDGDYFLCEYDGYENYKSYCHFKDILLDNKEEIQKLKTTGISKADFNSHVFCDKVKISIEKILNETSAFLNLLSNFENGFLNRISIFSRMNLELVEVKDILNHINFQEDGTVNFINIGENEEKENKILTLANILVKRKKGMGKHDIHFTKQFFDFMKKYQALHVSLARNSRNWIKIAIDEIYPYLNSLEDNMFETFDLNSKEEFQQQFFFKEELEEIIFAFQSKLNEKDLLISQLNNQLNEKDVYIESMKKDIATLTVNISERISLINVLNISIQEKISIINEHTKNMNILKISLEEKNKAYISLLNERNNLQDSFNNLNNIHQKLILVTSRSKEIFEKTITSQISDIQQITSYIKKVEADLLEEKNKFKNILDENEKLKVQNRKFINSYNQVIASINEHKYSDKERIVILENDVVSQHSNIEQIIKFIEEVIQTEKNKYNLLMIDFEKIKSEFVIINKRHQTELVSASNINEEKDGEINVLKNKYDNLLFNLSEKNNKLEEEKNDLLSRINQYDEIIQQSNSNVNNLNKRVEELNLIIGDANKHESHQEAEISDLNNRINNYVGTTRSLEETIISSNMRRNQIEIEVSELKKQNEDLLIEIKNLKNIITHINQERDELFESENKICDENDRLNDELATLKISQSELVGQLKAQAKRNEILSTQIEDFNNSLKCNNSNAEEITTIHELKLSEFKLQYESLIIAKEKLENELFQKQNDCDAFESEIEKISSQYERDLSDIQSMKEQLKIMNALKSENGILINKIEESNILYKDFEKLISNKDITILQLTEELNNMKIKNEELSAIVVKSKQSLENINLYENKIDTLENTNRERENLTIKIRDVEKLNQFTRVLRRGRSRRSKSFTKEKNMMQSSFVTSIQVPIPETNINFNSNLNQRISVDNCSSENKSIFTNTEETTLRTDNNIKNTSLLKKDSLTIQADIFLCGYEENNLLKDQNIELLRKWLIEALNSQSFSLNLIFKASKDGFDSRNFKAKCSRIPHTLIVAKTNHGKTIGGYTPLMWEDVGEDGFRYDTDLTNLSFLFSLSLEEKYSLFRNNLAICNTSNLGPIFGGGSDFEIVDQSNINLNTFSEIGHTYNYTRQPEEFYGDIKYLIEEYEVYQIIFEYK